MQLETSRNLRVEKKFLSGRKAAFLFKPGNYKCFSDFGTPFSAKFVLKAEYVILKLLIFIKRRGNNLSKTH